MATTNHERIGKVMELLRAGLKPYVTRELEAKHGKYWVTTVTQKWPHDLDWSDSDEPNLDAAVLLRMMWDEWNEVFRNTLGYAERSIVSELRDTRNRWAHQRGFSLDDTYRALDSAQRLLLAVSAPEAEQIDRMKQEVLRLRYEEETKREAKKAAVAATEGQPSAGLRPWREIVTPHPDVAAGRYQQAEFAADLAQVHRGEGTDEYRDPRAFYQRTYLTEGLRRLLKDALLRLSGQGGEPDIELQTNFGGGKTHSMLALYHLFSGVSSSELAGIEGVMRETGVAMLPQVQRAVLVGTALSPGQPRRKPDGTLVNTLWGELAWQLLGRDGYDLVAEADRNGTNPGAALNEVLSIAQPCLILIDEWVAYVRQLYTNPNLPAGSFEANLTFAQALTEAARAVPRAMVVASIPTSDIETGGEGGRVALDHLRNVFGRMESPWRPASAEEGFEIVRRRLFEPVTDPSLYAARDAVVDSFMNMYRTQKAEFTQDTRSADYERRMKAAYPIHPELFDRLYNDWSTLEKFQRTRGVLRLMAKVIHALWERDDRNLLIMPGVVPIDAPSVQDELTRYLEDPWMPIIEKDVDGPHSLPLRLDRENPNLARYSATRRVARTLYLGSAPTLHTAHKGIDDRSIKLGAVQPGESAATFGDALRRLADQATHLYQDGQRYWYSTQPSVNRLAQDRAAQQTEDAVETEIIRRLRLELRQRGDFAAVYAALPSGDIPDEMETRLVILGPGQWHTKGQDSPGRKAAKETLDLRGGIPRRYKNTLVFLAPDSARLADLQQAVRQYLAWKSIEAESETLNLDAFQANQAKTKSADADEAVRRRIPEAYVWLLVPTQPDAHGPLEWEDIRVQGTDSLAMCAAKKLVNQDLLKTQWVGTLLRVEMDRIPLWRGDHVAVRQLADDFAQYLYLPRLTGPRVLHEAIQDGVRRITWEQETFAYADAFNATTSRYTGLEVGHIVSVSASADAVVVKPEVARRQMDADASKVVTPATTGGQPGVTVPVPPVGPAPVGPSGGGGPQPPPSTSRPHRFHGTVTLDTTHIAKDTNAIADAVIQHLASLVGAKVRVTLEIEADIPDGAPENVVRTVTENCRTLKFTDHGFETE
ncbi:MAG: Swt1 family HEPN domain-containing protein [Anaerolineae bacterium]